MSLRPTALAVDKKLGEHGMYLVIDDPDTNGPLLIPCSWAHRRIDISRDDLHRDYALYPARTVEE